MRFGLGQKRKREKERDDPGSECVWKRMKSAESVESAGVDMQSGLGAVCNALSRQAKGQS